ncbi:MAG: RNA 2'-phosphotransferase [Vampirovibrionia bacterium]
MLDSRTLINLSKQIEKIILNYIYKDEFGYVPIEHVLKELNKHPAWEYTTLTDILEVIKNNTLNRLQISGDQIRLLIPQKFTTRNTLNNVIPPKTLFYGTTVVGVSRIKTFGIKSFKDKYIKLFPDKKMIQVLTHRKMHPAFIEIDAFKAHQDGIKFIKSDFNSYLAEYIPAKYINKIL